MIPWSEILWGKFAADRRRGRKAAAMRDSPTANQPICLLVVYSVQGELSGHIMPSHVMVTELQGHAIVDSYKRPADAPGLPRFVANLYAPDGQIVAGTGM